jgi:hypothetical protein
MRSYMWVSDADGHLIVCSHYLKNGDLVDIYLDLLAISPAIPPFFCLSLLDAKIFSTSRYKLTTARMLLCSRSSHYHVG